MSESVSFAQVYERIRERLHADPTQSYVAWLTGEGEDAVLQKIGEECTEVILAAKNGELLRELRAAEAQVIELENRIKELQSERQQRLP